MRTITLPPPACPNCLSRHGTLTVAGKTGIVIDLDQGASTTRKSVPGSPRYFRCPVGTEGIKAGGRGANVAGIDPGSVSRAPGVVLSCLAPLATRISLPTMPVDGG